MLFVYKFLLFFAVPPVCPPAGPQAESPISITGLVEKTAVNRRPLHSEDQEELQQHQFRPQHERQGQRCGRANGPEGLAEMPHNV